MTVVGGGAIEGKARAKGKQVPFGMTGKDNDKSKYGDSGFARMTVRRWA
jgi:hypothetical protein